MQRSGLSARGSLVTVMVAPAEVFGADFTVTHPHERTMSGGVGREGVNGRASHATHQIGAEASWAGLSVLSHHQNARHSIVTVAAKIVAEKNVPSRCRRRDRYLDGPAGDQILSHGEVGEAEPVHEVGRSKGEGYCATFPRPYFAWYEFEFAHVHGYDRTRMARGVPKPEAEAAAATL